MRRLVRIVLLLPVLLALVGPSRADPRAAVTPERLVVFEAFMRST